MYTRIVEEILEILILNTATPLQSHTFLIVVESGDRGGWKKLAEFLPQTLGHTRYCSHVRRLYALRPTIRHAVPIYQFPQPSSAGTEAFLYQHSVVQRYVSLHSCILVIELLCFIQNPKFPIPTPNLQSDSAAWRKAGPPDLAWKSWRSESTPKF